ncbi:MAG: ArsR family transcriptional regulator [Thermoplasmatota archaeon]
MAPGSMTDNDEQVASALVEIGLPKAVARCVIVLSQRDEATSVDLERTAGLRQPEVSLAMQYLRERAWAAKRDERRPGKGRPSHHYRLVVRIPDIVSALERERKAELDAVGFALDHLRTTTRPAAPARPPAPLRRNHE